VYSKCNLEDKRRLCDRLMEVSRSLGDGVWCMLGNFNEVRNGEERRGVNVGVSSSQALECNIFNDFLRDVELDDLNLLGQRYTWYHLDFFHGKNLRSLLPFFMVFDWFWW
jgi:hypothetical protein